MLFAPVSRHRLPPKIVKIFTINQMIMGYAFPHFLAP
jgi:hypothetical protein